MMTQKISATAKPPSSALSDTLARDMHSAGAEQYFGDISVYCAWSQAEEKTLHAQDKRQETDGQEAPDDFTPTNDASYIITLEEVPLRVWQAKRLSIVPTDNSGRFLLNDLRVLLTRLMTLARDKAAPRGVPIYFVLFIGEVGKAPQPLSWWKRRKRYIENGGATGGLAGHPKLEIETLKRLLEVIDEVKAEMGLEPEKVAAVGSEGHVLDAAFFEHYSASRRSRGHLSLDPRCSLVIDCAESDVLTLLTILQQAQITQRGLAPAGFAAAHLRVSLWDSNSDVQATLDDLTQINRESAASGLGQILLSFALAGIGTLLALTALPGTRPGQLVAPMLVYALASISYAFFALTGKKVFLRLGIVCLGLGTVVAIVIFVAPALAISLLPH